MDKKSASRVVRELEKRRARKARLNPEDALFGAQKAFVLDQSRLKVACCSRRAGKSFGVAFMLSTAALNHPGAVIPYITLTRETAKDIIHPAFRELDTRYELGLRFRENTGDVVFPNGSKIILRGASTSREVQKLRGPKYPLCAIDEAQGFSPLLNELIDEVLEPATIDYAGQIVVTGTPNAACAGPFRDMVLSNDLGWTVHGWTLRDNPHLPDVENQLAHLRQRRGWDATHPAYQREYCNMWVRDVEGLVFDFSHSRNLVRSFDDSFATDFEYVLGIDLGFNDPTAFVVLAYSLEKEKVFVVESYKEKGLIPSAVAAHVEEIASRYRLSKIVADTGGFGKGYAEEMKEKFGLPIAAAKKTDKNTYLSLLNGDLRTGTLVICQDSNKDLVGEISLLQWDVNTLSTGKPKTDSNFQDHLSDALLYAWRECRHYGADWEENAPKKGTSAWWKKQEEGLWEGHQKQLAADRSAAFWEEGISEEQFDS